MLTRARTVACSGIGSIRVLEPEDIIGLKVQAIANNPMRRSHDLFEVGQEARTLRARYGSTDQS